MARKIKRQSISQHSSRNLERPLFTSRAISTESLNTLLAGFEKVVHTLTRGKYLPTRKEVHKNDRELYSEKCGHGTQPGNGMILALRPSTLELIFDRNNHNAINIASEDESKLMQKEFITRLLRVVKTLQTVEDSATNVQEIELVSANDVLPEFLHVNPEKARQNIGDWLAKDPGLMISIPMIPKLIKGSNLGLVLNQKAVVYLGSSPGSKMDHILGYMRTDSDIRAVKISFYKSGCGTRDVDILREAGILQHIDHKRIMPKFYGLAVVAASENYCQWVTVAEFVDHRMSTPIDLKRFMHSELIRRNIFRVSLVKWFDWISLSRILLHNVQSIHEEGLVLGVLNAKNVAVCLKNGKLFAHFADFSRAHYGEYLSSSLLRMFDTTATTINAHGHHDPSLPRHVDPALLYDALVGPHHDMYSFGYILKDIGKTMLIPELGKLGSQVMQSRAQDRQEGGIFSSVRVRSELRSLTFRVVVNDMNICHIGNYELAKLLHKIHLSGALTTL